MAYQLFYGNPFTPGMDSAIFNASKNVEQYGRNLQNAKLALDRRQLELQRAKTIADLQNHDIDRRMQQEQFDVRANQWKEEMEMQRENQRIARENQAMNAETRRDEIERRKVNDAEKLRVETNEILRATGKVVHGSPDTPIPEGYVRITGPDNRQYDVPQDISQAETHLRDSGYETYDDANPRHQPKVKPDDPNDVGYTPGDYSIIPFGGKKLIGLHEVGRAKQVAQGKLAKDVGVDWEQQSNKNIEFFRTKRESVDRALDRRSKEDEAIQTKIKAAEADIIAAGDDRTKLARAQKRLAAERAKLSDNTDLEKEQALLDAQMSWHINNSRSSQQPNHIPDWVDKTWKGEVFAEKTADHQKRLAATTEDIEALPESKEKQAAQVVLAIIAREFNTGGIPNTMTGLWRLKMLEAELATARESP